MQRNTISGGARKEEEREREDRIDRGGAKLREEGRRMERSGEKVSHLRQDIMDNFLGRDSRPPSLESVERGGRGSPPSSLPPLDESFATTFLD